ncbi:MAG: PPC domain-containing DNA-binding protein [Candidatus Methanosuratincola sp.]
MGIEKCECLGEYMYGIPHDSDLLASLKGASEQLGIAAGVFTVIGALKKAVIHYYVQEKKQYRKILLDAPLEIASGIGNIAVKDGDTIVHCHVVLADKEGRCFGGHLGEGSIVFAGEAYIRALSPKIIRKYDQTTGLNLLAI